MCYPENYIYGSNIVINLTINDGFDVESKWYINGEYSFSIFHPGRGLRVYTDIRSYDIPGQLDISINASNPVSFFIDSITIYNYYRLKGFSFNGRHGTINEDTEITLKLSSSSPQPQGTVHYIIEFGDGSSTSGMVSSTDAKLMNPGLSFLKRYNTEASYIVTAILSSPVDTVNLTSEIKIVEPIRSIAVSREIS